MKNKRISPYQFGLHSLLMILTVLVGGLALENRELKQLLAPVEPVSAGSSAQPIAVQHLDGSEQTLSFSEAEKESLLLVFTTTCPACSDNQPAWRAVYEANKDRYRVLGIGLDDAQKTAAYRKQQDLPFPVVLPTDYDQFAVEYGITQVPFTIHVDRRGKVVDSWVGALSTDTVLQLAPTAVSALNP